MTQKPLRIPSWRCPSLSAYTPSRSVYSRLNAWRCDAGSVKRRSMEETQSS